jgi:hypothetical protein
MRGKAARHSYPNEYAEIKRNFVTGINCQPETARAEMIAIKQHYGEGEGVVAYHGCQSFAPGEAAPEMAHQIGVELAERLWGDRFQVIAAAHLDTGDRLHNHFALNNVSMVVGKKYYRSERDYYNMARESDAICNEYGLPVIEQPNYIRVRGLAIILDFAAIYNDTDSKITLDLENPYDGE